MQQSAIGYIRVSTDGQATDGVSLDAQRARIEAWCLANGMKLGEVFVDAGLSGGLRANGQSMEKIAAELTCRGIPTKEGNAWGHSTVRRILNRSAAA